MGREKPVETRTPQWRMAAAAAARQWRMAAASQWRLAAAMVVQKGTAAPEGNERCQADSKS